LPPFEKGLAKLWTSVEVFFYVLLLGAREVVYSCWKYKQDELEPTTATTTVYSGEGGKRRRRRRRRKTQASSKQSFAFQL
jgi:hypothetical protein